MFWSPWKRQNLLNFLQHVRLGLRYKRAKIKIPLHFHFIGGNLRALCLAFCVFSTFFLSSFRSNIWQFYVNLGVVNPGWEIVKRNGRFSVLLFSFIDSTYTLKTPLQKEHLNRTRQSDSIIKKDGRSFAFSVNIHKGEKALFLFYMLTWSTTRFTKVTKGKSFN